MRWGILLILVLVVLLTCMPYLSRFGIGRLPGDINFSLFGRKIEIPLMSTLLIALVIMVIGKLI